MDLTRLEQILDRASSRRITVIGDLMLDEFVWGKVGRISPEAPVPVVEVTGESFYPGGAVHKFAQVAGDVGCANLWTALGSSVCWAKTAAASIFVSYCPNKR